MYLDFENKFKRPECVIFVMNKYTLHPNADSAFSVVASLYQHKFEAWQAAKQDGEQKEFDYLARLISMTSKLEISDRKVAELQAKVDSLMLEYCPGEMTSEQMLNYESHQVRVENVTN